MLAILVNLYSFHRLVKAQIGHIRRHFPNGTIEAYSLKHEAHMIDYTNSNIQLAQYHLDGRNHSSSLLLS